MKSVGKYSIYRIGVASILKRFFSSVVDTLILSAIVSICVFFLMKPQLMKALEKEAEQDDIKFQISSDGKVNFTIKPQLLKSFKDKIEQKESSSDKKLTVEDLKEIIESKNLKLQQQDKSSIFFEIFGKVRDNVVGNSKIQIFIVFINCIYYMLFLLSSKQATIGQQLFGLMTIKNNGERLNFNDALNRTCLYYLLKITAFTIFFSKKQETIYDYLSKTQVIEIQ